MGEIFNTLIIHPIINVLVAIYQVLFALHVPFALGFSIIILTILIRFLIFPLVSTQLRASKKMQAMAPHLANVKEKHKGDSKRIQEETMKLYKEHGVNPAAGCLPVLVQLPVIWGLYGVLNEVVKLESAKLLAYINGIVVSPIRLTEPWDTSFFGLQLGQSPSTLIKTVGVVVIAVPVITGLFQFIQSKMMISPANKPTTNKKGSEDFATAFQTQSVYIFPAMIAFFSYGFPLGLSLYWNTFTVFGIIQQYKIAGLGGMEGIWQKIKKQ